MSMAKTETFEGMCGWANTSRGQLRKEGACTGPGIPLWCHIKAPNFVFCSWPSTAELAWASPSKHIAPSGRVPTTTFVVLHT